MQRQMSVQPDSPNTGKSAFVYDSDAVTYVVPDNGDLIFYMLHLGHICTQDNAGGGDIANTSQNNNLRQMSQDFSTESFSLGLFCPIFSPLA